MAKGPKKTAGDGTKVVPIRGTKADTPKASDNLLPMLSDDQRRGLFITGLSKLERLIVVAQSAASAVRAQRKVLKADGFESDSVDFALYARKAPEAEVRQMLTTQAKVLELLAHPLAAQADLFAAENDRTPAVDRAYDEGKVAGLEGKPRTPPHAPDTPQAQRWLDGHSDGQAVLAKGFKPLADVKGMPGAKRPPTPVGVSDADADLKARFDKRDAALDGGTLN